MSPLHQIGEAIRELLLKIPLSAARGLFLLFLAGLLVWVLTLPRSETSPAGSEPGKVRLSEKLKFWAAVSLVLQILIYLLL
jgi:hypothetical protein